MTRDTMGGPATRGRRGPYEHDRRVVAGSDLPPGVVGWALASVPTLLGLGLTSREDGTAVDVVAVASQLTLLAVAVGLAVHHQQSHSSRSGWLSAAMTVPPVAISLSAIAAVLVPSTTTTAGSLALALAGAAVSLAWVVVSGTDVPAPAAPVAVGFAGGAAACAVSMTVSLTSSDVRLDDPVGWVLLSVLGAVLVVLAVVAAGRVLRRCDLGRGVTTPLLLGGTALAGAAVIDPWAPRDRVLAGVAIALYLVAWLCFLAVSVNLMSLVSRHRAAAGRAERERALEHELGLRHAQAMLHEVRATVAGLAGATRLMADADALPAETRGRLEAMGRAEIDRMQRMLSVDARPAPDTDLGTALAPVVESLRARGHRVEVRAGQGHCHEEVDEVAGIVHVLLDNAARHGCDPIELVLDPRSHEVRISVTDAGPGVPEVVRDTMFEWGASGGGSTGIGLYDARARARAIGGHLDHHGTPGRTRFDLVLPTDRKEKA